MPPIFVCNARQDIICIPLILAACPALWWDAKFVLKPVRHHVLLVILSITNHQLQPAPYAELLCLAVLHVQAQLRALNATWDTTKIQQELLLNVYSVLMPCKAVPSVAQIRHAWNVNQCIS